jgi:hypothetical protein
MKQTTSVFAMVVFFCLCSSGLRAEEPNLQAAARRAGLSEADVDRMRRGEIVVENLTASSDQDLALAIAMELGATLSGVRDFVDSDRLSKVDTVTLARGPIDPEKPSLSAMQLPKDVRAQLVSDPTGTFSLSESEAGQMKAAAAKGEEALVTAYQGLLEARASAYWKQGLAGIEDYAGKGRSPRTDLGYANAAALDLIRLPALRAELIAAPAESSGGAEHSLEWSIEKARGQASPVLIHRIRYGDADRQALLSRHFYSGYDYDALQILVWIFPSDGSKSAVFYTNHTYTSQVAGFGGGAKRSIGRKLLQQGLVAEMQRVQEAFSKK